MGLLETIKEQNDKQQTTETLERLTSTLPAVELQLIRLTRTVAELLDLVAATDEEQSKRNQRLLASLRLELPSTMPLDEATKNRLTEIEKTLASVAGQLSKSEAVKLPDGSSVRRSELEAFTIAEGIREQLTTMTAASADLATAVTNRGHIRVDMSQLTAHAVNVLDARLAKAVETPLGRIEATLHGFDERVAAIGAEQVARASQELERVADEARDVVRAVHAAERRVEALAAKVTWTTAGRLGLALVPVSAVLLMVGGLTMGAFHALGVGPLLGWAWASFEAADEWWAKSLIAAGALGGIGAMTWVVWKCALRLRDAYHRW